MYRLDGDAIAAVAGEEAADAPDAVADGGGRGGEVEDAQAADLGPPALQHQRGDAEHKPAKPGKARRIPQHAPA